MTAEMTTAEEYVDSVLSGETIASKKIRRLCEILKPRFEEGYRDWHYDRRAAERPVRWIEQFCYRPSGRIGVPFNLDDYEKFIVEVAFGFVDSHGKRQIQEVMVWIARKNGKTSLVAAILQYLLVADGEGAPQLYCLGVNEAQASLCYGAADKMRRQSPALKGRLRAGTVKERNQSGIINDRNMGYICTLASNAKALDGLDTHGASMDEFAAWRDRGPYDLVKQSTSARDNPQLWLMSTANFVRNSIGDAQYDYAKRWLDDPEMDERFIPFVWELDDPNDWTGDGPRGEEPWYEANPGLGTVKSIESLRGYVQKAKNDPSFRPTLLTKDFNVPQNQASAWLTYEECGSDEVVGVLDMGFDYGIAGFDAADSIDLTCAQMLLMRKDDDRIYETSMYWIPEDQLEQFDESSKERDDVPYRLWESQGYLRVVPGNHVPKSVFLDWLVELRDEHDIYTYAVGYDPWHMDDSTVKNLKLVVGESRVHPVRQGAITLSEPMKRLKADYRAHRIVDDANPITRFCRMNVMIRMDVNGNISPYKKELRPSNRIDGFMAELDAYVTLQNEWDGYQSMLK